MRIIRAWKPGTPNVRVFMLPSSGSLSRDISAAKDRYRSVEGLHASTHVCAVPV